MTTRVNIYVPGIMTLPGAARNWSGRAVTFTHRTTGGDIVAEKVEYFTTPLTRPLRDGSRARKLARTIEFYRDWAIRLIGHSNGCDVILDALKLLKWSVPVEQLHLVCAACEADFGKNGLNGALQSGAVGEVFTYVAEQDKALRWARTVPGRLLGFGTLGIKGPQNVDPAVEHLSYLTIWHTFGHSDCWRDENFEQTCAAFTEVLPP